MTAVVGIDFDGFYQAHYGPTVALAYGFTADLPAAQDIAQEAFCRAWQRWQQLSTYDNPAAWVRHVATNLAHSRWRRLRVATAHLMRQRLDDAPAPDPDHVAVVTALRKLPARQRQAIVLHHMLDMPLGEVAEQLDVPVGTVKAWLHRGRAALARDLAVDVRAAISTPPTDDLVRHAGRHKRARTAATITILMLVVVGILATVQILAGPRMQPPVDPVPSPTSTPTLAVDDPIRRVAWWEATIDFLPRSGCPQGKVTFHTGQQATTNAPAFPQAEFQSDAVALGDLDGDGLGEAAVPIGCIADDGGSGDFAFQLAVIKRDSDGNLRVLGWAGPVQQDFWGHWIAGGVLFADLRRDGPLGQPTAFRWDGDSFAEADASSWYPQIKVLNIAPVAEQVGCLGLPGQAPSQLTLDSDWEIIEGGRHWDVATNHPVWVELGRIGQPYLMLDIGCKPVGGSDDELAHAVVVFEYSNGEWRALAAVRGELSQVSEAYVQLVGQEERYRWHEGRFVFMELKGG